MRLLSQLRKAANALHTQPATRTGRSSAIANAPLASRVSVETATPPTMSGMQSQRHLEIVAP